MIRRNTIGTGIGIIGLITVLPLLQGSGSLSLNASAFDLVRSSAIRTSSVGSPGKPSVTPQRGSSNSTSAVMGKIEGILNSISNLQAEMQQLLEAIKSHLAKKPKPPGENATIEEKNKYQAALGKWENQLTRLHKQLSGLQNKLGKMQAKLSALQEKELPAAQRQDAKNVRDMRRNR